MSIIAALPYNLTNGSTADATQVMANFNQIVNSVNSGAAENGTNSSITQLTGLSTPLTISQGGTGANSAGATAANNIGALAIANNLSDLNNVATARTSLGLLSMALQAASAVAITGGTIGAGVTISGAAALNLLASNNLSDLGSLTTALTNLGFVNGTNYVKLPGGKLIQWGTVSTAGSGIGTITFPTTFPSSCDIVIGQINDGTSIINIGELIINAGGLSTSGATIYCTNGSSGAAVARSVIGWIAIGK